MSLCKIVEVRVPPTVTVLVAGPAFDGPAATLAHADPGASTASTAPTDGGGGSESVVPESVITDRTAADAAADGDASGSSSSSVGGVVLLFGGDIQGKEVEMVGDVAEQYTAHSLERCLREARNKWPQATKDGGEKN